MTLDVSAHSRFCVVRQSENKLKILRVQRARAARTMHQIALSLCESTFGARFHVMCQPL